jgi:hypothetical protein
VEIVLNRTSRVLSASAVLAAATLLSVAPVAAQNWKAAPFYETLNLTAGFMPDPVSRSLQAGGVDSNSIDGTGCAGFINAERPDYDLNYTAGSSSLYIYARSGSDITLLVNDPSGSWDCSDDWDGTDPMIHFESPSSGNYNVWVGTYSSGQTQDATLYFTEMDPSGSVEEMPDVSAVPVYETITLSSGFMPDPVSRSLQAGGGSPNPVSGPGCLGYINLDAPDFDLNYTAGSPPLYIYARSESDITLLVNDPSELQRVGGHVLFGPDPGCHAPLLGDRALGVRPGLRRGDARYLGSTGLRDHHVVQRVHAGSGVALTPGGRGLGQPGFRSRLPGVHQSGCAGLRPELHGGIASALHLRSI